ncbi:hypothetical protein [Tychonema sp. LEGE 07203]|uniref:hypothetical protein n=1 Tax=Tychonema sp. LEGE 07203 TaxID=1828671 RepID=UPI001880D34B|nr:hypothetical protein [Tychonema sp. LEGE 07203]MBE9095274.1 hypothetical protein [Tychonema sp. LEGE 07203]
MAIEFVTASIGIPTVTLAVCFFCRSLLRYIVCHALRKSWEIIAKNTEQDRGAMAAQARAEIVAASSPKRGLDLD